MCQGVEALEGSNPGDQLAWFVLRFIAELSPCTETSLITYVSGGDSTSELGHTASASHTRELICNALLKLKELAFIQLTEEQIAITDEGRRFLDKLPVVALRQHDYRSAETSETKADHAVATEYRERMVWRAPQRSKRLKNASQAIPSYKLDLGRATSL